MSVHSERVQHHARMEALVRTVLAPITVTVLKDMLAQIALSRVSNMMVSLQRLAGTVFLHY